MSPLSKVEISPFGCWWGEDVKELLSMSRKERDRLKVIEAVNEKRLKQTQAAEQLGLSVRQIKRLVRAQREEGAAGLVSKMRGRASHRRISQAEREATLG